MTSSPTVTVMIPSYNYDQYLAECVRSALDQPGVNVDVALIENASTDGSLAVATQFAAEFSNIRLIVYPDNQGIMSSLNRCYAEIKGDYALLLCADDRLVPGSLLRSVEFLEAHPSVGMVYGPALDFSSIETFDLNLLSGTPEAPIIYAGPSWIDHRCRAGSNPIRTPEVLIRTSTIAAVGGRLDERCPHTSDLNMWLRLASQADVAFLPGPPIALVRRHGDNHSNAYNDSVHLNLEARWTAFSTFLDTVATRPERSRWERMVRSKLASEARYYASRVYSAPQRDARKDAVELLSFADRLDPQSGSIVDTLGWKVRRALGPRGAGLFPGFWPRRLLHRRREDAAELRRLKIGL